MQTAGADIALMALNLFFPFKVDCPTSTLLVTAISNRQKLLSPQVAIASDSSSWSKNKGSSSAANLGSKKVVELSPGRYVNRVSSSRIPGRD